tara:strand:+ start:263 stop:490 length:228 start_codon:yes stop_codon:yes gene_type:complete
MDNIISTLPKNTNVDSITLQKMVIIYNAIQDGWEVKRKNNNYIFIKKHEGKKEVYLDNFLKNFIKTNVDFDKIVD